MSYSVDKETHRVRYGKTVAKVQLANRNGDNPAAANDLHTLRKAMEDHIRAKNAWDTNNTDQTMIHLIGSWARVTKIMLDLDAKYD